MAKTFYIVPDQRGFLAPASQFDAEIIAELPRRELEVTVKQKRSLPQHRLYWLILTLTMRHINDQPGISYGFSTPEGLHDELKWEAGLIEPVHHLDGSISHRVKSTAFDKMDQLEFAEYFRKAMDILSVTFWGGEDILLLIDKLRRHFGYTDMPGWELVAHPAGSKCKIIFDATMSPAGYKITAIKKRTGCGRGFDDRGLVGEVFQDVPDAVRAVENRIIMIERERKENETQ